MYRYSHLIEIQEGLRKSQSVCLVSRRKFELNTQGYKPREKKGMSKAYLLKILFTSEYSSHTVLGQPQYTVLPLDERM